MTTFVGNVFLLAECLYIYMYIYIYRGTNYNCSDLGTVCIVINLQK